MAKNSNIEKPGGGKGKGRGMWNKMKDKRALDKDPKEDTATAGKEPEKAAPGEKTTEKFTSSTGPTLSSAGTPDEKAAVAKGMDIQAGNAPAKNVGETWTGQGGYQYTQLADGFFMAKDQSGKVVHVTAEEYPDAHSSILSESTGEGSQWQAPEAPVVEEDPTKRAAAGALAQHGLDSNLAPMPEEVPPAGPEDISYAAGPMPEEVPPTPEEVQSPAMPPGGDLFEPPPEDRTRAAARNAMAGSIPSRIGQGLGQGVGDAVGRNARIAGAGVRTAGAGIDVAQQGAGLARQGAAALGGAALGAAGDMAGGILQGISPAEEDFLAKALAQFRGQ